MASSHVPKQTHTTPFHHEKKINFLQIRTCKVGNTEHGLVVNFTSLLEHKHFSILPRSGVDSELTLKLANNMHSLSCHFQPSRFKGSRWPVTWHHYNHLQPFIWVSNVQEKISQKKGDKK
jgi:hypothetical protein